MKDDIAYHELNPDKGVIINRPGGPNVYTGVPKDYTGKNLNSTIFLDVLAGKNTNVINKKRQIVVKLKKPSTSFLSFLNIHHA